MTAVRLFVARVRFAVRYYRWTRCLADKTRRDRVRRAWKTAVELSFVDDDGSIGFFPF